MKNNGKIIARNILGGGGIFIFALSILFFGGSRSMMGGLMEMAGVVAGLISVYLAQEIKKENKNQNKLQ